MLLSNLKKRKVMKLIYLQPVTEVITSCYAETPLMANSILTPESDNERGIGGGPTNTGGGGTNLPVDAGETDGNTDPYGGKGSGTGGDGNRSKTGMIWDEW